MKVLVNFCFMYSKDDLKLDCSNDGTHTGAGPSPGSVFLTARTAIVIKQVCGIPQLSLPVFIYLRVQGEGERERRHCWQTNRLPAAPATD